MRLVRLGQQPSRVAEDIRASLASLGRGITVVGGVALVGVRPSSVVPQIHSVDAIVVQPRGVLIVLGVDLPDPAMKLEAPLRGPWKADGWALPAPGKATNPATPKLELAERITRHLRPNVPSALPIGTVLAVGPFVDEVDQPAADVAGQVRVLHPTAKHMLAASVSLASATEPCSVGDARALLKVLAPEAPSLSDEILKAEGFGTDSDAVLGTEKMPHPEKTDKMPSPEKPGRKTNGGTATGTPVAAPVVTPTVTGNAAAKAADSAANATGPAANAAGPVAGAAGPAANAASSAAGATGPAAGAANPAGSAASVAGSAANAIGAAAGAANVTGSAVNTAGPAANAAGAANTAGSAANAASAANTAGPAVNTAGSAANVAGAANTAGPAANATGSAANATGSTAGPVPAASAPSVVVPPVQAPAAPSAVAPVQAPQGKPPNGRQQSAPVSRPQLTPVPPPPTGVPAPQNPAPQHPARQNPAQQNPAQQNPAQQNTAQQRPGQAPGPGLNTANPMLPPPIEVTSPVPRVRDAAPAHNGKPRAVKWLPYGALGLLAVLLVLAIVLATTTGGDEQQAAQAQNVNGISLVQRAAATDSQCAAHAVGDLQAGLQRTGCVNMKRASFETTIDGKAVAVSVAVVTFADTAAATSFKRTADTPGGGSVPDLALETNKWPRTPHFDGTAAYFSGSAGPAVRLVLACYFDQPSKADDPGLVHAAEAGLTVRMP